MDFELRECEITKELLEQRKYVTDVWSHIKIFGSLIRREDGYCSSTGLPIKLLSHSAI